jgi:hypothetical protein
MICPNCNTKNELTWKKYLLSPFGRYTCENCQAKFRLAHSFRYYLCIVVLWCVSGVLAFALARYLGASFALAFSLFWVAGLGVVVPLDRKIDNTWRGTKLCSQPEGHV